MNRPPSSSSVSRAVQCAGCARTNPAGRKFCSECGDRLWQPCWECKCVNAVDEKFCGDCGANLHESAKNHEQEVRKKLEMAVQMEREGRFYEAHSTLRYVIDLGDERLATFRDNAQELLHQLDKRRRQRSVDAEKLAAQARLQLKRHQYGQALKSLQAIPIGLRRRETTELIKEVESLIREVKQLTGEIKRTLKAKSYTSLIPKLQRLCELQPENSEARKLAEKLSQQRSAERLREASKLAVLAEKKIKEHRYGEANEIVARIDPDLLQGRLAQIYRQVKEVAWCSDQVRRATIVTPALLKAVQRWQKLVPTDGRTQELIVQITERLQSPPPSRRFPAPSWSALPKAPLLGFPVKPWSGIGTADFADTADLETWSQHPGQFLVAYGLALQGLGQAVLTHDLNPTRSSWSKLLTRKQPDRCWALDIGATSIKALELVRVPKEDKVQVTNCLRIPHAQPLHAISHADQMAETVGETVGQFVEQTEAKRPRVALGFSARRGLARFFDLPPLKSKKSKLEEVVGFEIQHQLPIPADETIYDFHAWEPRGDGFVQYQPVAAIAARRDDLQHWVEPVTEAGCEVALLQCDSFALYNALHREFLSRPHQEGGLVILDVGGDVTNVVVGTSSDVWIRSIQHGVKQWDLALTRGLSLTKEQAEKLRKNPSLGRWMHQVMENLEPDFSRLADEIQRSMDAYPRRSETDISIVLGVGGGFSQFGFLQHLLHGPSFEAAANKETS